MFGRARRRRRRAPAPKHYRTYKEQARRVILQKVEQYIAFYGFQLGRISIRNQRTRWASCSEKGNLNFSYKILFLPDQLSDYIVVHELCHLRELNHSTRFWELVAKTFPDYKERRKALRNSWRVYA